MVSLAKEVLSFSEFTHLADTSLDSFPLLYSPSKLFLRAPLTITL